MSNYQIQKLKKEIRRLIELAYKDELTKLYNRRGFKEESHKFLNEVIASKKYKHRRQSVIIKNFSLIVFDIDNFKKINDTYGHPAGDMVIKNLSKIILENVRSIDLIARWGGEEFVVGLVGASENDAFRIADDIRGQVLNSKLNWRKKSLRFTISGGVADLSKTKSFDNLFGGADKALYSAKKSGKNKIVKFNGL